MDLRLFHRISKKSALVFLVGLATVLVVGILLAPLELGQKPSIWQWPKNMPPAKLTLAAHEEQLRAQAFQTPESERNKYKSKPIPTRPDPQATGFSPIPHRPAGAGTIVESGLAPLPEYYLFENEWYERKADKVIQVYAGRYTQDAAQGLVMVSESALDGNPLPGGGSGGVYVTLEKHGSVHIIGATGERLVLQAQDGTTFIFDVAALKFVPK